jgi:hypothetical protein
VDVISQGRDPKRDFRLPLSRRWRIVAGCAAVLVVAVALTVTGLRLQHTGTSGASGTSGTSGATGGMAVPAQPVPVPLPGQPPDGSAFMVCAKSAHGCTNKFIIVDGRAVHFAQQVRPSGP